LRVGFTRTAILSLFALAITISVPSPGQHAHAAVLSGTTMPDSVRIDQHLLRLNGVALYSRLGIPILVAGLWLDHRETDAEKILRSDTPRRYVTHFLRHVGAKRICDAWNKGLQANTPSASASVREQFHTLCSWTRDFRSGDEITVTYIPGRSSMVDMGGVRQGILPGKEFADAYFACAIGPKPGPGEKFKKHLLGL